jgi:ADP-L-glycero-D-manno-heptose 6-epimerase
VKEDSILVTGGAGFIGSNLIRSLNQRGSSNIIVADDLSNGRKALNLSDLSIQDYINYRDLIPLLYEGKIGNISCIFHQGACTDTTEWDGNYMMETNYEYSKSLLNWSLSNKVDFIYASSASVYGTGTKFVEDRKYENPINVYAYSKFLFDEYVRSKINLHSDSNIIGLRYFNVFGFGESHKEHMTSPMHHFYQQLLESETIKLFKGSGGYNDGEQERDYIYIDDVVKINLWFYDNFNEKNNLSGIYNTGTGKAETFNIIAKTIIEYFGRGNIQYIDFPKKLLGSYQSYTQADISALRNAGYNDHFTELKDGISLYLGKLEDQINKK